MLKKTISEDFAEHQIAEADAAMDNYLSATGDDKNLAWDRYKSLLPGLVHVFQAELRRVSQDTSNHGKFIRIISNSAGCDMGTCMVTIVDGLITIRVHMDTFAQANEYNSMSGDVDELQELVYELQHFKRYTKLN